MITADTTYQVAAEQAGYPTSEGSEYQYVLAPIKGMEGKKVILVPITPNGELDVEVVKSCLAALLPQQVLLVRVRNGATAPVVIFQTMKGRDKTIIFELLEEHNRAMFRIAANGISIEDEMDTKGDIMNERNK